jgi:hypothetical protein
MASTYIVKATAVAFAGSKYMLDVFNPTGSGKIVRIYRIWVENNQVGPAVTGVTANLKIFRTTAASAGVTLTPVTLDSTNTALGTITAGTGRTITASSLFRNYFISNDEPVQLTGSNDEWQQFVHITELWNSGTRNTAIDPIVCREAQGIAIQNSIATTVGNIDLFTEFTVT